MASLHIWSFCKRFCRTKKSFTYQSSHILFTLNFYWVVVMEMHASVSNVLNVSFCKLQFCSVSICQNLLVMACTLVEKEHLERRFSPFSRASQCIILAMLYDAHLCWHQKWCREWSDQYFSSANLDLISAAKQVHMYPWYSCLTYLS